MSLFKGPKVEEEWVHLRMFVKSYDGDYYYICPHIKRPPQRQDNYYYVGSKNAVPVVLPYDENYWPEKHESEVEIDYKKAIRILNNQLPPDSNFEFRWDSVYNSICPMKLIKRIV